MKNKAFTLLEMLLVLTLVALFFGLGLLYTQTSTLRADLNTQADELAAYVRLAQSAAASGKEDQAHGIRLEADSYTLFLGTTYNELDTSNTLVTLPPTVEIQNISLNGGSFDLIFSPPYGETENYGSFQLVSLNTGDAVTLMVNTYGSIEY